MGSEAWRGGEKEKDGKVCEGQEGCRLTVDGFYERGSIMILGRLDEDIDQFMLLDWNMK